MLGTTPKKKTKLAWLHVYSLVRRVRETPLFEAFFTSNFPPQHIFECCPCREKNKKISGALLLGEGPKDA